jgi:serine O-acetyltransferase
MTRKRAEASSGPEIVEGDAEFKDVVRSLTECADDALSQAACGGIVDPAEAVSWTEFAKRLILYQRDEEILRTEVPELAKRLSQLLAEVELPASETPESITRQFMTRLAEIRSALSLDLEAAREGDPAAQGYTEIAVSYPSIQALTIYRVAHELHILGVTTLPRIMSEYAHSATGIDIHPGATIGSRFFIDHGTGVVIGETTEIGDGVRLYQGVTLGAASLRDSSSLRGRKRHPTVEDGVTIYSGATILGGETVIGKGSVIGGNVWITSSIAPGTQVIAEPPHQAVRGEDPAISEQLKWDL